MRLGKWVVLALGGAVVALGGGAVTLVLAASPHAVPPTSSELQASGITFVAGKVPNGMIGATQATKDLLTTNGGHWTRFPSQTHVATFGYVSDSQIHALSGAAVTADSALQATSKANVKAGLAPARVHHVAVWEITFGGLELSTPAPYLPPGSTAKTDGAVCSDQTAFVDAKTGRELWEMLNDCTPVQATTSGGQTPSASSAPGRVVDTAYGYSVPIPAGWKANGFDGLPTDRTRELIMAPPTAVNEDIMVTVCKVGAQCPDPNRAGGFQLVSKTAARGDLKLGSTPASRYTETWRTASDTRVWRQPNTVATHAGYTYDVYMDLPIGVTVPPTAYNAVVHGWRWLAVRTKPKG